MKRILKLTIVVLLLAIMVIGRINSTLVYGVEFQYDEIELDEFYYVGEEVSIPNATFKIDGKSYEALKVIYYPNGDVLVQNELIVSEIGKYDVEYRVTVNGKVYKEKTYFFVNDYTFETNVDGSYAFYGEDESIHQTNHSGINVSLKPGDVFKYNKIIDLNSFSKEEPFIEMFVLPKMGAGNKEVTKLYIELVDIYDSTNFVRLVGTSPDDDGGATLWWQNNLYVQAGISTDYTVGIEWTSGITHINNKWGYPVKYSVYGMEDGKDAIGDQMLSFYIDLETKRIYGSDGITSQYITDLSDSTLYSETWDGFTTGEVYLRVSADVYHYESFNFMITKVGNYDLSEEIKDTEGPRISVDYGRYNEQTLPKGKPGQTYPVFHATANDSYTKEAKVITRVWRNYYSPQRYELNIVEGRFKTKNEGIYYIEYSSKDKFGNETMKIVEIEVVSSRVEPDLAIDLDGIETQSKVGEKVKVAPYEILSEGIGFGTIEILAKQDNEIVNIEGDLFLPKSDGTYEIIYLLTDFTGQTKEVKYSLRIVENNNPVFFDNPILPKYVIAGYEYDLPEVLAYDYIKQEEILSDIYVTDGLNNNYKLTDSKYTFIASQNGFITIKYKAVSATGTREIEFEIPIIEAYEDRSLKLENYFDTNTLVKEATNQSILLTTLPNLKEANFVFANPLSSENFILNFTLKRGKNKINKMEFTLTDMIDENESIRFTFIKDPALNTYSIFVNDELSPFNTGISLNMEMAVELHFSNSDKSFSVNGGLPFLVKKYLNGNPFNGFSSKKVYLETNLKEVDSESSMIIYNINGQAMTNDSEDFVRPTIFTEGQYKSVYHLNDVATIFKAYSFDVVSPTVKGTVSVQDAKNNYVKDINGLELKNVPFDQSYSLELTNYGTHLVTYSLNDGSGMSDTRFVYTIFVDDNIKPEITILKTNKETAKLGEKITIASAIANDNFDGNVEVFYFISKPNQTIESISKDNLTYTFLNSGVYKIIYMAVDETGNMNIIENIVTVSK